MELFNKVVVMTMNVNPENRIVGWMMGIIQHYNPPKYWKYRSVVVDSKNKTPKWIKLLMLFYIKKCDAFNCASMGTNLHQGATFKTPPILPHGLNGIIIHYKASFGANCKIYQQVTIAGKNGQAAIVGDNVSIGSGAKIIGGVTIGDNVIIGANTVVTKNIPSNSTVVGAQMRFL